ncbi:vacuolar protein sorting-associated protein 13C-like, partial [Nannospalax galili]|uniref:vacuolar protein sorting-associated protein 13C-like n=1 Tax=Nannospalax galili TaxID=1026970 RepID=UPI0004ED2709
NNLLILIKIAVHIQGLWFPQGAKKEGAAGFFKGIGKGLVGAVARPTGGIIDMASSTFQGIQRAAESTEEVSSLRPPRLIHEDGIIRPYDRQESEGSDLLEVNFVLYGPA